MKGRALKLFAKLPEDADWVRVSKVRTYTPGEETVSTSDNTCIDTDDDYLDHTAGMIDPGEVSFSVEYSASDAGQTLVNNNLAEILDFKLQWRDGSGETYQGTVTKRGMSEPNDDELLRNYTVKRKGKPEAFAAP